MHPNDFLTVDHTEILYDNFFRVERDRLKISGQPDYDYYTLVTSPVAVMVVAKTADGRYVLNWEYRHPVKKTLLSCPGGILEKEESPLECAARELLEETGYKAERFEKIGEAYPFPGICPQKTVYVRAENAVHTGRHALERAEFILETVLLTPEELQGAIKKKRADRRPFTHSAFL